MASYEKYLKHIDKQHDSMCDLLIKWSDQNSGSRNLAGLAKMLELIKSEYQGSKIFSSPAIKEEELAAEKLVNSYGELIDSPLGQVLSIKGSNTEGLKILLVGHMDTVFPESSHFQKVTKVDENTFNGPGVADLKGGLIVMLKALEAYELFASENDIKQKISWEILINPDEEIGSPGSAPLLEAAAKRNNLGLVFEPSLPDGSLVSERKGAGNFTVVVHGLAAHSGREFEKGQSAIVAISEFILGLHGLNDSLDGVTVNVGQIEGGAAVNMVPDLAICRVNIRTQTVEDELLVSTSMEALKNFALERLKEHGQDQVDIEIHGSFGRKPKSLDTKTKKLLELLQTCGKELNLELKTRATGGCCDGNNLADAGLPNIDTLGVRGGDIHSDKEYVLLDSLTERAKLTALLLMKLASGELSWDN